MESIIWKDRKNVVTLHTDCYKIRMSMEALQLTKQYDYYVDHEQELLDKYNGLYLVISDTLDVFAFSKGMDAYNFGAENIGLGKFLIQECKPGKLSEVNYANWVV